MHFGAITAPGDHGTWRVALVGTGLVLSSRRCHLLATKGAQIDTTRALHPLASRLHAGLGLLWDPRVSVGCVAAAGRVPD